MLPPGESFTISYLFRKSEVTACFGGSNPIFPSPGVFAESGRKMDPHPAQCIFFPTKAQMPFKSVERFMQDARM